MWTVDSLEYGTRKKLTIDHTKVGATLTNFPVLVKLTDARFDWTHSNSDGFDVRFTASDGTTLLKYERERHDGADYAEYWVKIPSVSSTTDTDFYIYYRTTDTADGADPTNVWSSNYKMVHHMKDDPDTSHIADSTSNNNDGTKTGAGAPASAAGQIATCQNFDGSDDHITVADSDSIGVGTSDFVVEFWLNQAEATDSARIIEGRGTSGSAIGWSLALKNAGDDLYVYALSNWSPFREYEATIATNIGGVGWHHFIVNWDRSGNAEVFMDGTSKGTLDISGGVSDNWNNALPLIMMGQQSGYYTAGYLDEVRLYIGALYSAAEIKAHYNSESDTLLTYGAEETPSTAYTQTCSETLSLTDTISRSTKFNKSISETLSMTEAVSKSKGMSKSLTETLSLSDAISSAIQKGLLLLETIHLTDTLQRTTRFAKTLTESISLTDTLASAKQFFVNLSETIGLTDAISKSTNFAKTLSETIHLTDVIKVTGWFWNYLFKRTSSCDYKSKSTNTWTDKTKSTDTWTYKDK